MASRARDESGYVLSRGAASSLDDSENDAGSGEARESAERRGERGDCEDEEAEEAVLLASTPAVFLCVTRHNGVAVSQDPPPAPLPPPLSPHDTESGRVTVARVRRASDARPTRASAAA